MAGSQGGKPGNPAWVKGGKSPNPGGRPKTTGKVEQYRDDGTADEMLDIMIEIARNLEEDSRVRITAADKVLDRLWGKPAQEVINTGPAADRDPDADRQRLEELRARYPELHGSREDA